MLECWYMAAMVCVFLRFPFKSICGRDARPLKASQSLSKPLKASQSLSKPLATQKNRPLTLTPRRRPLPSKRGRVNSVVGGGVWFCN